jgi:lysyl-tRNA synthetase class 2
MTAQLIRNRAIRAVRDFLSHKNILEVRTPKAVRSAALEPYIDAVALSGQNIPAGMYLATSPEFAMKNIFAAELEQNKAVGIYEIAPVFRDDPKGMNHATEFTMLEWYRRDCTLPEILRETMDCITHLVSELDGSKSMLNRLAIYDIRELFEAQGMRLDFSHQGSIAQKYRVLHGSLPQHLNEADLEIVCFNLLFDEYILPWLKKQQGPVVVSGYPDALGALAYTENSVAERAEIYWQGIELANAYREEWRPDKIAGRWEQYNAIRRLRGVVPHPIDENLLAALPVMQGVCGVAVGLERVLGRIFPALNFLI